MNKWILLGAAAALAAGGWWMFGARAPAGMNGAGSANMGDAQAGLSSAPVAGGEMVAVTMPDLSGSALRGQQYFRATCAACHGPNAGGRDGKAPPLIHRIYVPGHHGDMAIRLAAQRGVKSHHWRFGDMPPVQGLTDAELTDIIAFIRAVQQANGIS